jgi:hypothetical protein
MSATVAAVAAGAVMLATTTFAPPTSPTTLTAPPIATPISTGGRETLSAATEFRLGADRYRPPAQRRLEASRAALTRSWSGCVETMAALLP